MAAATNTYVSTSSTTNREDLSPIVYKINPFATPLLTMAARAKATNTLHEWSTQDLAAPADNAQAEGDDSVNKVITPAVRLNNRTQISSKAVGVSGTQQSVTRAGITNELAEQVSLASMELKTDIEFSLTNNKVSAASPRKSRGLPGFVVDNVNSGAGYTAASYTGNTAGTDGTARAFTEAQFKDVLQKVFNAGGVPDFVMMGPAAKQTFSSFSGNSVRQDKGEDQKLFAAIDVYVSDFGEIKAVPNRIMRSRDVFVLQKDKLAVAYLRPFQTTPLAKTGDADRRLILAEYCLEARAPKSCGAVYDIL